MTDQPAKHGHQHLKLGPDPIPLELNVKLYPAPGSIVAPSSEGVSSGADPVEDVLGFPGGVIVARAGAFAVEGGAAAGGGADGAGWNLTGASRNGSYAKQYLFDPDDTWADAEDCWSFKPVDDLGCKPGMLYGIFFQWHIRSCTGFTTSSAQEAMTGTPHLEAQSDHTDDTHLWINNAGHRFNNASSGPFELLQPVEMDAYGSWSMSAAGGADYYGDFPMQGNGAGQMVSFQAGETVTVKAWMSDANAGPGGTPSNRVEAIGIDHFVFMPRDPFADDETESFKSSALEVFGYYEDPQPTDVTEETDLGGSLLGGDIVQDVQELLWAFDAAGHFTVASHDEADVTGLYTDVGGIHVYVLCRGVMPTDDGTLVPGRSNGHVTTFAASQPLSDALCDPGGGWCWIYAGYMPLGTSMTGAVGVMCWLNSAVRFGALNGDMESVRVSFIAYVPGMAENLPAVRTDLAE